MFFNTPVHLRILNKSSCKRGTSFIEIIISVAIILTVFVGLFGVLKLGIKMSSNNKARIAAIALAQERSEYIHSLAYDAVGTTSGIPNGNIPQIETINLNGITFIRRTLIQYVDAPEDGLGAADENGLAADYKKARVEVNWVRDNKVKKVVMVTNIAPVGVETISGGGTLSLTVFNASTQPVVNADVHIVNSAAVPPIDVTTKTNAQGRVLFPGTPAAASFEISVTKNGMSTSKTYDANATNTNPNPGHLTVAEGNTTSGSFSIDTLGSITIHSFDEIQEYFWEDLFDDVSKISTSTDTEVDGGSLQLLQTGSEYATSGIAMSEEVHPLLLREWKTFSLQKNEPVNTSALFQLWYDTVSPKIIPEVDLVGNASGFATTTIDISHLSTSTYSSLFARALLASVSTSTTPAILNWKFTYEENSKHHGNINFNLRGEKTIGAGAGGDSIYKLNKNSTTNINGEKIEHDIEWDLYHLNLVTSGYDIARVCNPLPLNIAPGENKKLDVYLLTHDQSSLLVDVRDNLGVLLDGVEVQLTRGSLDETKQSLGCGQVFFQGLMNADDYELTVSKTGYISEIVTGVQVDGQSTLSVILTQ